jgi:hypothetical protein
MDAAYLHLLVNHFPIILSIMGVAASVVALLVHRRGAWLYAAASLTIAGAVAYPVMLTGHAAEDVMKHKWYVTKESIQHHEDAADIATWVLVATGVVNAFAWWRIARAGRGDAAAMDVLPARVLQGLVLVTGLAGLGTVSYAALQGGKIVHGSSALDAGPGTPPAAGATAAPAPAAQPAQTGPPTDSAAAHHM